MIQIKIQTVMAGNDPMVEADFDDVVCLAAICYDEGEYQGVLAVTLGGDAAARERLFDILNAQDDLPDYTVVT